MKLETKFNINQRVFLIYNNEICNFRIIKVFVEVFIDKEVFTHNEVTKFNIHYDLLDDRHYPNTKEKYKYSGDKLFATKEELLNSL